MTELEKLLREKNKRLIDIPLALQTNLERQQSRILSDIIAQVSSLNTKDGKIEITTENIKKITKISDELKSVFLSEDYIKAVTSFSKEFDNQKTINEKLIKKGFGDVENSIAANAYVQLAKRNAIDALVGSPMDVEFIKPIQSILENAVVNGSSYSDLLGNITTFVKGNDKADSKILKYAKQITNDTFATSDRSFTSIISDVLEAEWFYYSGSEVASTRCFCAERVDKYFYYKEIEAWGDGKDLGDCNVGGGKWAGEMGGTNSSTIYTNLGGYNCMHSLMPVSIAIVPESDINRAIKKGYYKPNQ